MNPLSVSTNARARAFSLIEVLMAVLILSLGLLGLGAIMPAVVKQQRIGADQTHGTLAARSVAALIKGSALLNSVNPANPSNLVNPGPGNGSGNVLLRNYPRWEAWARCITGYGTYTIPLDGTWRVLRVDSDANGVGTGRAVIGPTFGPGVGPVDDAFINLPDRLFPSPWSVTAGGTPPEPQFVVDLAVRRMTPIIQGGPDNQVDPGGALLYERPGNFTVQMALFARRIDVRIRPMVGVSIMQSIADTGAPINKRRWPVSEDDTGNPLGDGTMTGAGAPRYSLPYTVNVAFDPNFPDRLVVQSADDSMVNAATQRSAQTAFRQMSADGQIVVDNLGTVYNILGVDDRVTGMALRISPPVKGNVPASGGADPRRLHQVVVCPQSPASVNVITVNP